MRTLAGGLIAVVALTVSSNAASAQLGAEIGVRGGVSVASASFDLDTFDPDNRTGFVGGPFVDLDLGLFGVQVAALYHQMGFEDPDFDLKLSYIEVPAVLKVGLPLPLVKPSVFAGVGLGFEGSCEINGADCTDGSTNSTQYSGVAGADVKISLGRTSLWLDGRYNFGLNDVNDALDQVGDFKNRAWNFTVGIGFGLL